MARKLCEFCGSNLATDMVVGVSLCPDCRSLYSALASGHPAAFKRAADPAFYSRALPAAKRLFEKASGNKEAAERRAREQKQYSENYASMIMTTGSFFEGYRVERYLDVICEEVVFKNSVWKQLGAGLEDFGNALSFGDREMSGASEMIANARQYVMEKFKKRAAGLGANAVLGVEFESSLGSDVVRVSISGTAVYVEKKEREPQNVQ